MLRPSAAGKQKVSRPASGDTDSSTNELKFIADLGRSLLFTVHPKKVASRVAEALRLGERVVDELRGAEDIRCDLVEDRRQRARVILGVKRIRRCYSLHGSK